jgi:uncharacterized Zn-finger protein
MADKDNCPFCAREFDIDPEYTELEGGWRKCPFCTQSWDRNGGPVTLPGERCPYCQKVWREPSEGLEGIYADMVCEECHAKDEAGVPAAEGVYPPGLDPTDPGMVEVEVDPETGEIIETGDQE